MTEPTTAEERAWLAHNWGADDPTFRQWIAGSDKARTLVPDLIADVGRLTAECNRLSELLREEGERSGAALMERADALAQRDEAVHRAGPWTGVLEQAARQDVRWWRHAMPTLPDAEAVYAWAMKAQEELGELSAALLGQLIGKEGRGQPLEECDQLIAVLLRVRQSLSTVTPDVQACERVSVCCGAIEGRDWAAPGSNHVMQSGPVCIQCRQSTSFKCAPHNCEWPDEGACPDRHKAVCEGRHPKEFMSLKGHCVFRYKDGHVCGKPPAKEKVG